MSRAQRRADRGSPEYQAEMASIAGKLQAGGPHAGPIEDGVIAQAKAELLEAGFAGVVQEVIRGSLRGEWLSLLVRKTVHGLVEAMAVELVGEMAGEIEARVGALLAERFDDAIKVAAEKILAAKLDEIRKGFAR